MEKVIHYSIAAYSQANIIYEEGLLIDNSFSQLNQIKKFLTAWIKAVSSDVTTEEFKKGGKV